MSRLRTLSLLFALSLASGCVIGRVLYTNGEPYSGALVTLKSCDTCSASATVTTDEYGYFSYDPYSLPGFPNVPLFLDAEDGIIVRVHQREWRTTAGSSAVCHRTGEIQVAHRAVLSTYVQPDGTEVDYTIVPEIYVQKVSTAPVSLSTTCSSLDSTLDSLQGAIDLDNDGVTSDVEGLFGTSDFTRDRDADGLSDAIEIYGMYPGGSPSARTWSQGSDIRSRGATPTRKDAFIEVDYWQSATGTMRPSSELKNMVAAHYGALDYIVNPDGSTGMDVVLFTDDLQASLTGCTGAKLDSDAWASFRGPRRDGIFTHGLFCRGGFGGAGLIPGGSFYIVDIADLDETNNMTEEDQNVIFSSFLHEFGHTLGLEHGGFEGLNCKPNYPSDMNYAYFPSFGIDGDNGTLATSKSQYSTGEGRLIVESGVPETDPLFAPFGSADFLEVFGGFTSTRYRTFQSANGNTDVDWDRSGGINGGSPPNPVRNDGDINGDQCRDSTFRILYDNNDAATIVTYLDDNVNRLNRHERGSGSGAAAAGTAHCGVARHDGLPPRGGAHGNALANFERLTHLSGNAAKHWLRRAGVDPANPKSVRYLEKQLEALPRGNTAKRLLSIANGYADSVRWLSRNDAEKAVLEGAKTLLEQRTGKDVNVAFVDCPLEPKRAKERLLAASYARDGVNTIDDLDEILLCR